MLEWRFAPTIRLMKSERVIIVGAGIVGLAHAWSAAERGHQVTVLDRSRVASGASIRNFGMIWPMGQPEESRSIAMKSRERWLQLAEQSSIWVNPCGSIHLAHRVDEWNVLREFYETSGEELRSHLKLLEFDECLSLSPGIQPNGLLGGMWSDMELCVNPARAVRELPHWLSQKYGISFSFECAVSEFRAGKLRTSRGAAYEYDRAILCSGDDFETLYPEIYHSIPIRKCKLQMFRTVPQTATWRIGPHLASGLTLRHYSTFKHCRHLKTLVDRIANETPELDRYGIHVMASQDDLGRVVLGDSHLYGEEIEPFDSVEINRIILRELHKIIRLPNWTMESFWHGTYAKYASDISFQHSPEPNIHICTGLGGSGMTLSFGLAERNWDRWTKGIE